MAKIFVLEDDKDIREVMTWILESEYYEVVTFNNVSDFKKRDVRELPDLFILDVMLPDGSGLDVCNQLRSDSAYSQIPILIMSAHASMEQIKRGCQADGFIQKPFKLDFFLQTIRIYINPNTLE